MKNLTYLVFVFGMLSACSQEVDLTYNCVPSGATVYETGIGLVGTCPVTLKYNVNDVKVSDGKLYTDKISVVWLSGASMIIAPTALEIPDDNKITMTFFHPENSIDAGKDRRFGAAYDASLPQTEEKYVVTTGQYKSFFDAFNNTFTCTLKGAIGDVRSQCP